MAEGASWARWDTAAAIQATIANTVRDSEQRKKPFVGDDFHPHLIEDEDMNEEKTKKPLADVSILKSIFVDNVPIDKVLAAHGIEE